MFKRFINSDSSSYYITWSFNFPQGKIISDKTEYCDKSQVFNYTKLIKDNKKNFHDLHEKSINLHVFKSGYFGSSDHGSATISLANLET